ncbi:MAG: choice-of-anchor V domain-containing protein [Chitinophagales bacterium]
MLKKFLLLTALVCVYAILVNNSYVYTNDFQPPTGRTGAPGELTCSAASCHNTPVNSGTGSLDISFSGGDVYEAGVTYDMSVVVNDNGGKFGFEMIALSESGTSIGSFDANGAANITVRTIGGKQYISHKNAPSSNTFNFKWTAPNEDAGAVTFYAAGNAANGNGASSGDKIYTNNYSTLFTGIERYDAEKLSLNTFPNPATNYFNLEYQLAKNELMTLVAYDASGRQVKVLFEGAENAGVQRHRFDLQSNELTSGVYLIMLQSETFISSTKLFVQ